MSLVFFDGFDQYDANSDLFNFGGWTGSYNGGASSFSSTVRSGATGKCAVFSANSLGIYVTLPEQAAKTVYVGVSINLSSLTVGNPVLSVMTAGDGYQATVILTSGNVLSVYRGGGSTLLASGSIALSAGVWYYVELKALVADASGILEVKINGTTVATYTGDTQSQGTNTFTRVAIGGLNSGQACSFDDFYILNSDGSVNNTYLGEQRVEIITPTSDSTVAWTRNTGATNFSAVDDLIGAPDDDTTYVSSSTSTQKDEYGLSNLVGTASAVAGVKVNTRAEKDDANPLSFKNGIKSGATNQQVTHTLGQGYSNFIDYFETSDGGSTAFTGTTVNSLLSTIEVV